MCFDSGPPDHVTQTTETTLPPEVRQQIMTLLNRGTDDVQQGYSDLGSDARVAGFTADQQRAMQGVRDAQGTWQPYTDQATSYAMGATNPLVDTLGSAATPGTLSGYMNPYRDSVIDTSLNRLRRQGQVERQGIAAQAANAGAFGGDRATIAAMEQQRNEDQSANELTAKLYDSGYGQALGQFNAEQSRGLAARETDANNLARAAGQVSNLGQLQSSLNYTDLGALQATGATQQALNQTKSDIDYSNWREQRDWSKLNTQYLAGIIHGFPTSAFTGQQTRGQSPSAFSQAVGLAQLGIGAAGLAKQAGLWGSGANTAASAGNYGAGISGASSENPYGLYSGGGGSGYNFNYGAASSGGDFGGFEAGGGGMSGASAGLDAVGSGGSLKSGGLVGYAYGGSVPSLPSTGSTGTKGVLGAGGENASGMLGGGGGGTSGMLGSDEGTNTAVTTSGLGIEHSAPELGYAGEGIGAIVGAYYGHPMEGARAGNAAGNTIGDLFGGNKRALQEDWDNAIAQDPMNGMAAPPGTGGGGGLGGTTLFAKNGNTGMNMMGMGGANGQNRFKPMINFARGGLVPGFADGGDIYNEYPDPDAPAAADWDRTPSVTLPITPYLEADYAPPTKYTKTPGRDRGGESSLYSQLVEQAKQGIAAAGEKLWNIETPEGKLFRAFGAGADTGGDTGGESSVPLLEADYAPPTKYTQKPGRDQHGAGLAGIAAAIPEFDSPETQGPPPPPSAYREAMAGVGHGYDPSAPRPAPLDDDDPSVTPAPNPQNIWTANLGGDPNAVFPDRSPNPALVQGPNVPAVADSTGGGIVAAAAAAETPPPQQATPEGIAAAAPMDKNGPAGAVLPSSSAATSAAEPPTPSKVDASTGGRNRVSTKSPAAPGRVNAKTGIAAPPPSGQSASIAGPNAQPTDGVWPDGTPAPLTKPPVPGSQIAVPPQMQRGIAAAATSAAASTGIDPGIWRSLMVSGLATMAGTSPFGLANIGKGGLAGVQDFEKQQQLKAATGLKQAELARKASQDEATAAYRQGVLGNRQDLTAQQALWHQQATESTAEARADRTAAMRESAAQRAETARLYAAIQQQNADSNAKRAAAAVGDTADDREKMQLNHDAKADTAIGIYSRSLAKNPVTNELTDAANTKLENMVMSNHPQSTQAHAIAQSRLANLEAAYPGATERLKKHPESAADFDRLGFGPVSRYVLGK